MTRRPCWFTVHDDNELCDLAWLGERYQSAELLYQAARSTAEVDEGDVGYHDQFPLRVELSEHEAWEILDATDGDGGDRGTVPCLGGRLGDEIHQMLSGVI